MNKTAGEVLKEIRLKNGLTRQGAEGVTGISQSTIRRWEEDRINLKAKHLCLLENYLDITKDQKEAFFESVVDNVEEKDGLKTPEVLALRDIVQYMRKLVFVRYDVMIEALRDVFL